MGRRLRFAMVVVVSQILLIAVSFAWLLHMALIAIYGSVSFVEENPAILWGELVATVIIIMFAAYVLVLQILRLRERRRSQTDRDDNRT